MTGKTFTDTEKNIKNKTEKSTHFPNGIAIRQPSNKARWEYLNKLANDMHDDSEHKLFWNYLFSRRKGSNDLIDIRLDSGNVLTNEGDIAECMNEYFASVFTAENFDNFPSFDQVIKDKDLSLHCSPKDVSKILSELKPRKSPGPDSIHPMILTKCAEALASSLSDVFNVSCIRHVTTQLKIGCYYSFA